MKVIFLDVDGVLNNGRTNATTPLGFTGISNSLLDKLAKIAKETDAKIVLSTSWKDEWDKNPAKRTEDGDYLVKKLKQKGLFIFDKIDESETGSFNRGSAILLYVEKHPEIDGWVVLDDFEFDFYNHDDILEHWVQTSTIKGLCNEDVEKAIAVLNDEDVRHLCDL